MAIAMGNGFAKIKILEPGTISKNSCDAPSAVCISLNCMYRAQPDSVIVLFARMEYDSGYRPQPAMLNELDGKMPGIAKRKMVPWRPKVCIRPKNTVISRRRTTIPKNALRFY